MRKIDEFYDSLDDKQKKVFKKYRKAREAEKERHLKTTCVLTSMAACGLTMYLLTLNLFKINK